MADARLYEAKRTGRNRIGTSTPPSPNPTDVLIEAERLEALANYEKAGAVQPSESLDGIARLTAQVLGMPMAFVSLVGREDVFIVGRHNVELEQAFRDDAYCAHTIQGEEPLVVPSTLADPRFSDNLFTKAGIGFYAGAPLISFGGHKLGALCVVDHHARQPLDDSQRRLLVGLARLVIEDLEERCPASELAQASLKSQHAA